ncbi:MAG: hypothetical protein FJ100_04325 [Deltaproteobacteria bacterium]|nr:hypothetical protein [Deltaproteobacteria bacterium]
MRALAVLLPGVALALLYGPGLADAQWVLDDGAAVTGNPLVAFPPDLRGILAGRWFGPVARFDVLPARPLVTLSYCLELPIGLDTPTGRRMVNLALAWACAWLLGRAVTAGLRVRDAESTLADRAGLAASLVWVVHPALVEIVACPANRPELMGLLFCLLALRSLQAARPGCPAVHRRWAAAAAWWALALLSKESALAFVVLAAAWAIAERLPARQLRSLALALATALAAVGTWRVWNLWPSSGLKVHWHDNPLVRVGFAERVWTGLDVAGQAIGHALWPESLSPDYTFDVWPVQRALTAPGVVGLGALLLAAAAVALALRRWRARRADPVVEVPLWLMPLVAAVAWYLPVSNLLVPSTVLYGDRLLCAPLAALAAVAGCGVAVGVQRTAVARARLGAVAAVVLAVWWAAQAARYAPAWRDNLSLYAHAVATEPRSFRMQANLSHEIVVRKAPLDPVAPARAALALDPKDAALLAIGLDAAAYRSDCAAAEPFVLALEHLGKPAQPARLAALNWGWRCGQFARAFAIGTAIKPSALGPVRALEVYALGIAAGNDRDAERWARYCGADPAVDPRAGQARMRGAIAGGRFDLAERTLAGLRAASPPDPALQGMADDLARARSAASVALPGATSATLESPP